MYKWLQNFIYVHLFENLLFFIYCIYFFVPLINMGIQNKLLKLLSIPDFIGCLFKLFIALTVQMAN